MRVILIAIGIGIVIEFDPEGDFDPDDIQPMFCGIDFLLWHPPEALNPQRGTGNLEPMLFNRQSAFPPLGPAVV